MATLRTDSPVSLSIVASFLQFLSSVELAVGTDTEGLEVAVQCLSEVFGLNSGNCDLRVGILPLVELFTRAGIGLPAGSAAGGSTISGADHLPPSTAPDGVPAPSHVSSSDEHSERSTPAKDSTSSSGETLLEQFREGLDLAGFFEGIMEGTPEHAEKFDQAKKILEEASKKVRSTPVPPKWSAGYSEDTLALAEAFKIQGNSTMSVQRYQDAIQLYTLAISLCSNNAIFYSNRAAALTHVGKYPEAIADCEVAIKLDPQYSKAFSRLGQVYFAQGRLQEAIDKGFKKALEIDPSSTSVQENLRAAQMRLEGQQRGREQGQPQPQPQPQPHPSGAQNSGNFTSSTGHMNMPMPPEIANLLPGFLNLAAQFGQRAQETQQGSNQTSDHGSHPGSGGNFAGEGVEMDPEVSVDGNFNFTFDGQNLPPQYSGLMESVFQQMFGGAHGQPPNTQPGAPPPGEH